MTLWIGIAAKVELSIRKVKCPLGEWSHTIKHYQRRSLPNASDCGKF
ncbi:hypothetical protein [Paenibacillus agricola]|uniref:Uncharacterized protein n=1 Tax=Paenibacillus agricola TaxID=2716264 RepID=A0ABX0IZR0_9BACL|nr:hypothetical protein [Paenibacillus agricola]NHN28294.1 hypothetical protein [Paenibacillus agricola]